MSWCIKRKHSKSFCDNDSHLRFLCTLYCRNSFPTFAYEVSLPSRQQYSIFWGPDGVKVQSCSLSKMLCLLTLFWSWSFMFQTNQLVPTTNTSGLDHVCLKQISSCPQQTLLVLITRFAGLKQQISVWSKSARAHNKYFWSWSHALLDWSSKFLFEANQLMPTTDTSGLDRTLWIEAANVCLKQMHSCPQQTLLILIALCGLKQQMSVWHKCICAHNKHFWSWSHALLDWSSKFQLEANQLMPTTNTSGPDCTLWIESANVCLKQMHSCPQQTLLVLTALCGLRQQMPDTNQLVPMTNTSHTQLFFFLRIFPPGKQILSIAYYTLTQSLRHKFFTRTNMSGKKSSTNLELKQVTSMNLFIFIFYK